MSYILEALRKAERERNPAQSAEMPLPIRQSAAPDSRLRRYRPLLVAAICLSLFGAVLALTLRHHAAVTAEPASAPAVVAATAPTPAADGSAMTLDQVTGDPPNLATLDDVVDNGVDTVEPETSAIDAPDLAVAPSVPTVGAEPPPAAVTAPVAAEDSSSAAPTAVQRVQLDPAPQPQVTKLRDMPADYRSAFPTLSLDVHVYDAVAQKRFVMVAGHRYNEGETLGEGPRIVHIVPEGVIFEFRGEQVLFTIAH